MVLQEVVVLKKKQKKTKKKKQKNKKQKQNWIDILKTVMDKVSSINSY